MLAGGNNNIADVNELETKSEAYIASNVEIISPDSTAPKSDIALLPKAENVNDIYESVYEFDVELQQKEYDMNSGIGQLMGSGNSSSQNQANPLGSEKAAYYGLQQQLITDINQYTRERRRRRFQLFGNQPQNDPTIAQINNPVPAVPGQVAGGGSSWFVFFSIGQRYANSGDLLASGQSDYVQQQLMLQQNSRANVENRARSFYGSRINPSGSNFRY